MFFNNRKRMLLKELKRIKEELVMKYHPSKIILFGSLISGKIRKDSDIDLVIVKDTEKTFIDRAIDVALLIRPNLAVDFLVYTPEEFIKMSEGDNYFFNEVIKGKVLYEE